MRVRSLCVLFASLVSVSCSEETPVNVPAGALEGCSSLVDTVVMTLYDNVGGSTDCQECIYCGGCREVESRSVCLPAAVAADGLALAELVRGMMFDDVALNTEYCLAVALLDVHGTVECSSPQEGWREVVRDSATDGACLVTPTPVRPDGRHAGLEVSELLCGLSAAVDSCVLRDPRLAGTRAHCCDPGSDMDSQCTTDPREVLECDADRIGVIPRMCPAGTSCLPAAGDCVCDERSFPRCGAGTRSVERCSGGEIQLAECTSGECEPASPESCL